MPVRAKPHPLKLTKAEANRAIQNAANEFALEKLSMPISGKAAQARYAQIRDRHLAESRIATGVPRYAKYTNVDERIAAVRAGAKKGRTVQKMNREIIFDQRLPDKKFMNRYVDEYELWARNVKSKGRSYYKKTPVPVGGLLEYGRASYLKHPEKAHGTFKEYYDAGRGQVFLIPNHRAGPRMKRGPRAARTEGSSYQ